MGKGKPKRKRKALKLQTNAPVPPDITPTKKKSVFNRIWGIIVGIAVIAGMVVYIEPIKDLFTTKHHKFEEENFDSGTLKAPEIADVSLDYDTLELQDRPIFNKARKDSFPEVNGIKIKELSSGQNIKILVGSGMWILSKNILEKGIRIFDADTSNACSQTQLNLILHNGRLYASAEFRDLKKEELVGTMNYNHWKVYLKNLLTYRYDEYRLEVLDKQGYVIFSIAFHDNDVSPTGVVSVSGYFMTPTSLLIVNTASRPKIYTSETKQQMLDLRKCITKDDGGAWRRESEKFISKIKSVFKQPESISF